MPMRRSSSGSSMRSRRSASARMSAPALMWDPSVTARVRTCATLPSARLHKRLGGCISCHRSTRMQNNFLNLPF